MVSVTVSAAGHPPSFARGLPFTAEIAGKDVQSATIADVKAAVAAKFPKVRPHVYISEQLYLHKQFNNVVLRVSPKGCFEDRQKGARRRDYASECRGG